MSILNAVDCGTLHLVNNDDLPTSWLINGDTSIPSGSDNFDTVDVSDLVPKGTKAVYLYFIAYSNDVNDLFILNTRKFGETTNSGQQMYTMSFGGEIGSYPSGNSASTFVIMPISEDGKFQYQTNATYSITTLYARMVGYFI